MNRRRLAENVCGHHGHTARNGKPCGGWCVPGGTACRQHGGQKGSIEQAKKDDAARKALRDWGLNTDDVVDPGEVFLGLIAQSSRRVQRYAQLLAGAVEKSALLAEDLEGEPASRDVIKAVEDLFVAGELAGLMAPTYDLDMFGNRIKIGEQIRALVKLEAEERDRLAAWCAKAISVGIEERRVRLAEYQGTQLTAVVTAMIEGLGLTPAQRALVPGALRAAVALVFEQETLAIEGTVLS